MITVRIKENCSGCYACVAACPQKCISMKCDEKGFWYPIVDKMHCIKCGKCDRVCPIQNCKTLDLNAKNYGYAAYCKDENVRLNSSSGGIFTLLAEWVISQGGVVFGAAYSSDFRSVQHIYVESREKLEYLRGSKYVQSKIGDAYLQAKQFLNLGRMVLFTGTPCQIGGLLSFLNKEYENLITQDLICHGVPSPMVWKEYVKFREKSSSSSTTRTFSRHKHYGWKRFSLLFEYSNKSEYLGELHKDSYLKGFLSDLYLRDSCYACAFKTVYRQSDITLADFWGVEKEFPEINDDKGMSFVWVHTDKGEKLIRDISDAMICKEIEPDRALKYNPAYGKSALYNKKAKYFWNKYGREDFCSLIRVCCRDTLAHKVRKALSKGKHLFISFCNTKKHAV